MSLYVDGVNGLTFPDGSAQPTSGYTGFRNRIINGAMVIDQRNAGAVITPTNTQYSVDRWACYLSQGSKYTIQQNAGSVTPPVGFANYLGVTSSSAYAVLSSDLFFLYQAVEGFNTYDLAFGTANARSITLSFWAYSSLTGTFGGTITNGAYTRSYGFTYSISSANAWTYITITMPGDTAGSWIGATNGAGLYLRIGLGCGAAGSLSAGSWQPGGYSSVTGAVSVVGTSGATFYITGVQLEKAGTATPFEFRPYGTELALCQRYCYQATSVGGTDGYVRYAMGECLNGSSFQGVMTLPVQMRITPSLTTPVASQFAVYTTSTIIAVTAISLLTGSGVNTAGIAASVASGLTAGRAAQLMSNGNNTSYLLFSAEL
jgi:hypothetical protein